MSYNNLNNNNPDNIENSEKRVLKKYQTDDNIWYDNNLRIYSGGYQIFLNPRYLLQEQLIRYVWILPNNIRIIILNFLLRELL